MKGTVVAVVTGLAALVAVGAAGGALLVERTLTEEATRALAAEGVDAHVTFSGLTATVSAANPEQLPTAPGVGRPGRCPGRGGSFVAAHRIHFTTHYIHTGPHFDAVPQAESLRTGGLTQPVPEPLAQPCLRRDAEISGEIRRWGIRFPLQ